MVPPTLVKVGQPVSEGQLNELKANAHDPAGPVISDDEIFEPPAEKMSYKVNVKDSVHEICEVSF
jgi:hypothetical protein